MKTTLVPIKIDKQPPHTKIAPRCLTCTKAPVCLLRESYLKTALLMEQILGNPQEDYELSCCRNEKIIEGADIFPSQISYKNDDMTEAAPLNFDMTLAKSNDNLVIFYRDNGRQIIISFHADYSNENFQIAAGHNIHDPAETFNLTTESAENMAMAAMNWRTKTLEPTEPAEYLNTTYFSATLNCAFYERDKSLTPELGAKRMFCNCDLDDYHHFATFHKYAPIPLPPKPVCRRKNVEG